MVSISKVVLRGLLLLLSLSGVLSVVMVAQSCKDGKSIVVLRGLDMEGEGRDESWEAEGISMVVFSGLAGEIAGM